MKKFITVLILTTLLFIPNVYAEDNYLEIDLVNKDLDNLNQEEFTGLDVILYSIKNTYRDNGEECFYDDDSNLMFKLVRSGIMDLNNRYSLIRYDGMEERVYNKIVVAKDAPYSYEYKFTDFDKINIENYKDIVESERESIIDYSLLEGYDGVRLLLRKEQTEYNSSKECDSVCINKVNLLEKTSNDIVKSDPSFEGLKLDFDLEFKNVDDYIKYEINLNNPTDKDYEVSTPENSEDTDFIKYNYEFEDDNNILKANSNKKMYVTVRYNKEVDNTSFVDGKYNEEKKTVIKLSNGEEEKPTPIEIPDTYAGISIFIIFGLIALLGYLSYNKLSSKLLLLLIPLLLIPVIVNAYEKLEVNVNTNIEIKEKKNILMPKIEVLYSLYEDSVLDNNLWDYSQRITTITFENKIREIDNYARKFDLSVNQDNSIIGYLVKNDFVGADETKYYDVYIMANGNIYANFNSSEWFAGMYYLEEINNIKYLKTDLVVNMDSMFKNCKMLKSIDVSGFNTDKVIDMRYMFFYNGSSQRDFSLTLGDKFKPAGLKYDESMFACINETSGFVPPKGYSEEAYIGNCHL